eukprot:453659_1
MDQHLLTNDYDDIAANIKTLSQNIQYISRQSDLIGGLEDTALFRKQLTVKIQDTSQIVLVTKNKLESRQNNDDSKYRKLEQHFIQNFERLQNIIPTIRTKFHNTEPQKSPKKAKTSDKLLDSRTNNNGYGSANGQNNQSTQQQQQEQLFKPYDDLYELENYEEQLFEILQNLQLLYESHKDLNMLIYDQEEVVEQLHDNVEEARDQVDAGVGHLDKAAGHQRAYRGKLCGFLGVLLVLAVIVTLIIVLSGNNK